MGNRLSMSLTGESTVTYEYDAADQMTEAGGVSYSYDDNGNQTSRGSDTFSYDPMNRLTSTDIDSVAGSYAYNGDGLRTSRTIDSNTVDYSWDQAAALPLVLQDSAGNTYVYGLDLISRSDSENSHLYYLYDGVGSTAGLTDEAGDAVSDYSYDVFGAIRDISDSTGNEFTFTGEQNDPTGLEYLRARYYDPSTGRFLSQDEFSGTRTDPGGENLYTYAKNNCVNRVDPLGRAAQLPGSPDETKVCTSWLEFWDLNGGLDEHIDVTGPFPDIIPDIPIRIPSFKLVRYELETLYVRSGSTWSTSSFWADETHLAAGWHIDDSGVSPKEGGGAIAVGNFGAGGVNPFRLGGWEAQVQLTQRLDRSSGTVTHGESVSYDPFQFPGLKAKSGMKCRTIP